MAGPTLAQPSIQVEIVASQFVTVDTVGLGSAFGGDTFADENVLPMGNRLTMPGAGTNAAAITAAVI